MGAASILIVEDEEQLQRMLRSALTQAGYMVVTAKSGLEALEQLVRHEFGVVLLDLGLPDMDGKEVIAQARSISRAPMLVVSARGSEREKIAALDLGANDYVEKPFGVGELLARLRANLRQAAPRAEAAGPLAAGEVIIDLERRLITRADAAVRLTPKEYDVLAHLARNAGKVVGHRDLLTAVWGKAHAEDTQYLRVVVGQLRQKLETDPAQPRLIATEPGVGYRLTV